MPMNTYDRKSLDAKSRQVAKDHGGKFVSWRIDMTTDEFTLEVSYKPRHWRHCPGCIQDGEPHYAPDGVEIQKDVVTTRVEL